MKKAGGKNGITITYPDEKKISEIVDGKELVFQVLFAEEAGNVEWKIQNRFLNSIFLMNKLGISQAKFLKEKVAARQILRCVLRTPPTPSG